MKKLIVMTAMLSAMILSENVKAEETAATVENCVAITMRVKGCGADGLSPCEATHCYKTYDFKVADVDFLTQPRFVNFGALDSSKVSKKIKSRKSKKKLTDDSEA